MVGKNIGAHDLISSDPAIFRYKAKYNPAKSRRTCMKQFFFLALEEP
jgi:hypothetical protein